MSTPLQLSVPEGAQIHIHLGPHAQLAGPSRLADACAPEAATALKRRPLRLAATALLLFGGGYVARGISTPDANAQRPLVSSLGLPPSTGLDEPPASAVLGTIPGLPSGIHVTPLPSLATLPGQVPAQLTGPVPGQLPGPYAGQLPRPLPGMVVRAPYPVVPDAPQASGQATPPAAGTPTRPRNPFGLE